ncbi:tar DNA-binding protein like protein 1 [Ditylenchus destructor]|nr:tar DNA-binding protein like protein 1 [Ditylenchus destructor]
MYPLNLSTELVLNKPIHTIGNRKCNVRVPLAKNGEVRDNPLASAKIFIGRLQEKTTSQQLKEFFLEEAQKIDPDAQILDVYIPKPFRAFAFITFSNPLIVKKMLKIGEFIVDGTSVTVSSAMPKSAQPINTPGHSSAIGPPQYNRGGVPFPEHGRFNDWHDTNNRLRDIDQYGYSSRSRISPQFVGNYPPMGAGSSGGAGGSMLATGLETLNLNNYKPEVVNAWKAFMNVAHNGGLSPPPSASPPHHYTSSLPPQYQQQMHNRRNGSSAHGPPTWR